MATPKKPRKKITRQAPKLEETRTNNLETADSKETDQMNLTVPKSFKIDFKVYAASKGMKMSEYCQKAHEFYKEHHGL
jgi:hypothetical protein